MFSRILNWIKGLFGAGKSVKLGTVSPFTKVLEGDPEWLKLAFQELGQSEVSGAKHNPRILQYHNTTGLAASADEVPWCSSFINWIFYSLAMRNTGSASARSWLKWGVPLPEYRRGAVVVFKRGNSSWQGHVALALHEEGNSIWCLGGNQGNAVSVAKYSKSKLLGYRWPSGV